ncbi:hypothetical protein [Candidatus Finniella inopinata]|nr:hypothetical protein [Candidatus Finniella inopinata]
MTLFLSVTYASSSSMFDAMPKSINTTEMRIVCADERKFNIVAAIQHELYEDDVEFDDVDGIHVQTEDGWWLLRASNTEPLLSARAESQTEVGLKIILEQMKSYLEPFGIKLPL